MSRYLPRVGRRGSRAGGCWHGFEHRQRGYRGAGVTDGVGALDVAFGDDVAVDSAAAIAVRRPAPVCHGIRKPFVAGIVGGATGSPRFAKPVMLSNTLKVEVG